MCYCDACGSYDYLFHLLCQRQPSRAEEPAPDAGSEVACEAWFGILSVLAECVMTGCPCPTLNAFRVVTSVDVGQFPAALDALRDDVY